jgi:uncharacterized membrane protein YeaQ/YmgE (transglycosylase-associated protein family)
MIVTIIWGIIVGAIVGMLGRLMLPGRQNISMFVTILVGIAAAVLGGIIATWLGVGETPGIDWIKHFIQLALAVLFVWLAARVSAHRHGGAVGPVH